MLCRSCERALLPHTTWLSWRSAHAVHLRLVCLLQPNSCLCVRTGKVPLKRKEIAQLIGKVFIQKSAVNLLSTVLDTPEFFWSAPDNMQVHGGCTVADRCVGLQMLLTKCSSTRTAFECRSVCSWPTAVLISSEFSRQALYKRVCEYMELDDRVEVLNNRLMVRHSMLLCTFVSRCHRDFAPEAVCRDSWVSRGKEGAKGQHSDMMSQACSFSASTFFWRAAQVLQEMLDMLRDHSNNAHSARLEWCGFAAPTCRGTC